MRTLCSHGWIDSLRFSSRRKPVNKMMLAVVVLAGACLAKSSQTCAQTTDVQQSTASPSQTGQVMNSQDVDLLRKDIRSKKKQLIAANLKLTEAEATKFWPIYDQYTQELIRINDKKYDLIKQYSQNWGSIADDQAMIWVRNWLDLDTAVTQLRSKYVPIVRGVLPGKKAATFFQLDRRISMMIDLQISSQIPLVQSQE
jgi:hypothetical protein